MNYLKSSLIGITTTTALLLGTGIASAQVASSGSTVGYGTTANAIVIPMDSFQTVTAIGNASSPSLIVAGPIVKATGANGIPVTLIPTSPTVNSAVATMSYVPANYAAGYYNYGSLVSSNYATPVYTTSNTGTAVYPGAPNTGGPIVNNSAAVSANINNTGTYIPPSYTNSIGGVTGGVSVPPGYSVTFGPYGNLISTNSTSYGAVSGSSNLYSANYAYPGAPNTGGPITTASNSQAYMNGQTYVNGQMYVTGVVTTVTPTAIAVSSGNQTWTVVWDAATSVSTTGGINNMTGAQITVGDMIEVTGHIDQTFVSQIDATSIRDISVHNI